MRRASKYSPELQARAVRMVRDHAQEYPSQWAAIRSISDKLGCSTESLRRWVRQDEGGHGERAAVPTTERDEVQRLRRENFELRRANEILKKAAAFFAQAELDRRVKRWSPSSILRARLSAGASPPHCASISCSMRWSRRSPPAPAPALTALVHHSDRGTQYLSMRYTARLVEAGIAPSVGSRGDSYDNALAESVIGLFKTELIQRKGPWRTLEAVEFATLVWVDWFNTRRLLAPIGYLPPAE